jgi:hypothetical protein
MIVFIMLEPRTTVTTTIIITIIMTGDIAA